jgi:hypothetical protein
MRKLLLLSTLISILLVVLVEPAHAQESSEQLDDIDWIGLVKALITFLADILEASAELLRQSVDRFSEMFGSA